MKRLLLASFLVSGLLVLAAAVPGRGADLAAVVAAADDAPDAIDLSPYWHRRVQQWSSLIVQEAERREIDPDFLASLVWMESRGDAQAIGPVGAVGLMQVMPREAGFSWRPSREALMDPETNLYWGTRTLATVVKQGKGDIFNALAAYNGGWDQIMYRGPKLFATTILRDYAKAIAQQHGLTDDWMALFAVEATSIEGPIWVADASRDDVYAYGLDNTTPEGIALIPDVAPTAVLASCSGDEDGSSCRVGMWLLDESSQRWIASDEVVIAPQIVQRPVPSLLVMAGSYYPGAGAMQALPQVVTPTSVPEATKAPPSAPVSESPSDLPAEPSLPTPTPLPQADLPICSGEPLRVDAWPLDRECTLGDENTPQGWKARVYVEGHGGNCVYTYAWNDETDIRAENVRGATTFEVTSTLRGSVIVGTVVVISGDEVQRVGMYIHPPKP